jgi:hypothetical protein
VTLLLCIEGCQTKRDMGSDGRLIESRSLASQAKPHPPTSSPWVLGAWAAAGWAISTEVEEVSRSPYQC